MHHGARPQRVAGHTTTSGGSLFGNVQAGSGAVEVLKGPSEAGRSRGAAEGNLADVFEYFDVEVDVL